MKSMWILLPFLMVFIYAGCKVNNCPEEMVEMKNSDNTFCIDKYENFVIAYRDDGTFYKYVPKTQYVILRDGKYVPGNLFNKDELKDKIFARSAKGIIPVDNVSWIEAEMACRNSGKRLCTEKEWNYACSGDGRHKYPYGNEYIEDVCSSFEYNKKVGNIAVQPAGYMPRCDNGKGVMDLSGNLWEWIYDSDQTKSLRALKGGGFSNSGYDEEIMSCPKRRYQPPDIRLSGVGFRCCKDR